MFDWPGQKGWKAGLSELRQHRDKEDEFILRTGSGLMDLKIINKTADEISIEFIGEGHTILNLLRTELLLDERVTLATYDTKFPVMDNPVFPPQDIRSRPYGRFCVRPRQRSLASVIRSAVSLRLPPNNDAAKQLNDGD